MLRFPFANHEVGVAALLDEGLTDAQAMGLVALSTKINFKKDARWKGSPIINRGRALHTWLWHFMYGHEENLRRPPATSMQADTEFSNNFRQQAIALEVKWNDRRRSAGSRVEFDGRMQEVDVLRSKLQLSAAVPSNSDAPPAKRLFGAATGGAGDPTPASSDAEQQRHTAALHAFAMGTHERLGAGYASRDKPCAVRRLTNDHDVLGLIADFVRCRPRRALEPPPREVQVLRAGMWREHKEKHGWRELAEERSVQLEAALADAVRAMRREAQAHAEAAALREQFDEYRRELQADSTAWRAAVERESERALKEQQRAAAAARREQKREDTALFSAERERAERAEAEVVRAKEDKEGDRRETLARYRQRELEADAARAQVEQALAELENQHAAQLAAMERLRNARNGTALERQAALEAEVQRLKARRKANQLKVSDANLARRATAVAQQQLEKERTAIRDFMGSGLDYAARAKQIETENAALLQKLKAAQAEVTAAHGEAAEKLKAARAEVTAARGEAAKYKAIAEPAKAKFFESGHFSAQVDQIIIECLSLGVARNKLPQLFVIFARFYGILIPGRKKKVPGLWVDGRRTTVDRFVYYLPGKSHVKEMAAVMNQLNKLHVGEWLLQHIESDEETSCCYLADGAESQQVDYLGQLLSRRVNGKLEIKALSLDALGSKTADAQAAAFRTSLGEMSDLMLKAGLVDNRAAELIRRFLPTCSMNDRASPARAAARKALGLPEGENDPTCAEHGLVNILEEGRKAMDKVLRQMMEISDAQAEGDAAKVKAMRTCVGWFSSPACALIYQVTLPPLLHSFLTWSPSHLPSRIPSRIPTRIPSRIPSCIPSRIPSPSRLPSLPQVAKYCALCSSKGYAIGKKFAEWLEARLADAEDQTQLLGDVEDLLAICGSRMYVFFLDAAVTERLLSQVGSLLTFLEEEDDLQAEGGGKLRKSILTGTNSPACMAAVRAMAVVSDAVLWPLLKAIKPSADVHTLDVLPKVWPMAVDYFRDAAARPRGMIDGDLSLDLGGVAATAAPQTAAQTRRSQRAAYRHGADSGHDPGGSAAG